MDNGERILNKLEKMDDKLDKQHEVSRDNAEGIKLIRLSLEGNGGKGLFQRMNETEDWQKKREEKAEERNERNKLTRDEIRAERAREAIIMAAIIGGVSAITTTILTLVL